MLRLCRNIVGPRLVFGLLGFCGFRGDFREKAGLKLILRRLRTIVRGGRAMKLDSGYGKDLQRRGAVVKEAFLKSPLKDLHV